MVTQNTLRNRKEKPEVFENNFKFATALDRNKVNDFTPQVRTNVLSYQAMGDQEVTANLYCNLRIRIGKVPWFAVYICGNFWVT